MDYDGDDDDDDKDSDEWDAMATVRCPYCGDEMLEDAPQCPSCGNYISSEDRPNPTRPLWVILGVVLCLLIVAAWIWR